MQKSAQNYQKVPKKIGVNMRNAIYVTRYPKVTKKSTKSAQKYKKSTQKYQ